MTITGVRASLAASAPLAPQQTRRSFLRVLSGVVCLPSTPQLLLNTGCDRRFAPIRPKVRRIGYLGNNVSGEVNALLAGLRDLGYIEGRTITIEWRFSADVPETRNADLAQELVALDLDLLVVNGGTVAARAAQQATTSIPIVAVNVARPVETGLVASLARPGGNLTALSISQPGISAKYVDLLRAIVPGLVRLGSIVQAGNPSLMLAWNELHSNADSAGIEAIGIELRDPTELDSAFERLSAAGAQALVNQAQPLLQPGQRLVELAGQYRMATMAASPQLVIMGLLLHYGPDYVVSARHAATYVDKVLRGANAAELPVEQPTTFELVVNANTLRSLGLTMPSTVLPLVTRWIE